ncbi:Pyruvate-flavodoxin oxidoreductase [Minicystis rosea]|nr:Pyruvate-flavodoxin oxidoreductase [Minicystis rosea]
MAAADALRDVVLQVEGAVCNTIFSTGPVAGDRQRAVATGAEAVLAAASAAHEGQRATAVLRPAELLGALEALHAVARGRTPITVHVLGGGGTALQPGRDELAPALDVGAGVIVTWSAQDSVDLALAARRAAEDSETPFVIVSDGGGPVMGLPGSGLVERFLGSGEKRGAPLESAFLHVESKRRERGYAARAPFALAAAMRELGDLTGRPLTPVERYETTDAEEVILAVGHAFGAARSVAASLRREGRRVGAVGVRALRPFFAAEVVKAIARARSVVVLEPLDVALAPAGPLATTLKAAFADALTWAPGFPGVGRIPTIVSVVFATLEGAATEMQVREALAELVAGDRAKRLLVFGSGA